MSEMVDRVALGIKKAAAGIPYEVVRVQKPNSIRWRLDKGPGGQLVGEFDTREEAINKMKTLIGSILSRAAIAAMREPTKEMVEAGVNADGLWASEIWEAMIDEALK